MSRFCTRLIQAAICCLASVAALADEGGMLSVGVRGAGGVSIGGSSTASVTSLEYRFPVSGLVSMALSGGKLSYTYENEDRYSPYREEGSGTYGTVDVLFHPGRRGFRGFYVGPGAGVVALDVDATHDYGKHWATRDRYQGTAVEVHGRAGWLIQLGPDLTLDPNVQIGYFLATPESSRHASSNLTVFVLAGVNLGLRF